MANRADYVGNEQRIHARMGKYNYSMREIYFENDTWFEYRLGEWYSAWMADVDALWGDDLGYEELLKYEFGLIMEETTSRGYSVYALENIRRAYDFCAEFVEGDLHSGDADRAAATFYEWRNALEDDENPIGEAAIELASDWLEFFVENATSEVRKRLFTMDIEEA